MMWHFYEIPYIPDLELVKYQSLGEQGIDGILERHNRFLRQWQRNTVLIHTTLHFFLSYTHERPKGSRLQIFLAFSSDQTVNFESIDALMQASPLADYYKIAPIEDVPVCLRKSFTNILLVKKQEQTRLSTGDTLFTVEGWKSNPKSRLYEMEKTAEALNEDTSIDDRQLIGSTMSASGIQLEHVAVYRPGEALMSYEGLQRPFELRIQEQKGHGSETPNDDELYDIMLHKPAFFQLAQKEENLKLETLKENVKSLKKKEVEALCALSEYDSSVHTSTQITDFYWHMENIYTSIVILRSQYRRDCQAINELFISAERKAMLDELIRSIGESLQQKIKNNVVFLDSNGQLE